MVAAQRLLPDGQSALKGRTRPRQIPQGFQHEPKVVDRDGHFGMIGAIDGLIDLEGALTGRTRPRQIPQVFQHDPKVVDQRSHVWML